MAGGAGAEVVGGLLAGSQLPQLRAVLEAQPLAAQLEARALLRLLKAFLQACTSLLCPLTLLCALSLAAPLHALASSRMRRPRLPHTVHDDSGFMQAGSTKLKSSHEPDHVPY